MEYFKDVNGFFFLIEYKTFNTVARIYTMYIIYAQYEIRKCIVKEIYRVLFKGLEFTEISKSIYRLE